MRERRLKLLDVAAIDTSGICDLGNETASTIAMTVSAAVLDRARTPTRET